MNLSNFFAKSIIKSTQKTGVDNQWFALLIGCQPITICNNAEMKLERVGLYLFSLDAGLWDVHNCKHKRVRQILIFFCNQKLTSMTEWKWFYKTWSSNMNWVESTAPLQSFCKIGTKRSNICSLWTYDEKIPVLSEHVTQLIFNTKQRNCSIQRDLLKVSRL